MDWRDQVKKVLLQVVVPDTVRARFYSRKMGGRFSLGKHTYGAPVLRFWREEESGSFRAGKYCSIADNVHVFLAGGHRLDWATTYPVSPASGPRRRASAATSPPGVTSSSATMYGLGTGPSSSPV